MRSSTRDLLFGVALGALALSALGAGGVAVALRHVSLAREQEAARAQESAATLVADTQAALHREARLLARDPALVDGVAKGDWATLARGVSPRLAAVTLERVADFVSVLDVAGSALLQVPALPPTPIPDPAAISASPPGLTVLNGHPYVVAAVPVVGPAAGSAGEARPAGFVVIARRLENVVPLATGASARSGMVFLVNGRLLVSSLQRPPPADWIGATVAGKVSLDGGRDFLVRPAGQVAVSGPGRLWLLVADDGERRRRALVGWLTGLGICGLGSAAAVLLLYREPGAPRRRAVEPLLEPKPSDPDLEVARRNRELEALNAVALSMGRSADVVATAGEMLDVVRALAQMDVGGVHQLDPTDGTLTLIAQRGLTPEFAAHVRVRPVNGSYVGEAARTGRLIVTHLDPSSLTDPWLTQLQAVRAHRTQLALPIPVKGRTWGVMSLVSQEQRKFLTEEVKVLEAVAHQIGQVVERALLLAQMEEQSRRLETLARIGHSLTAARSLEDVLAVIVEAARRLLADGAARLAVAEGDRLRFCAEAGMLGRSATERVGSLAFGEGVTGRAAASRQPILIDRIEAEPEIVGLPWLRAEGFVSGAAIPLLVRERLVGVLNVLTRTQHVFVAADMDLLLSFASHAAIAIDNAQLFTEAQQSAARYRALFEVSGALASSLELDQILDIIVERCQGLTGAAAVGIFRAEPDTGLLTYARATGVSSEFLRGLRLRLGEGTAGRALRERSPVWTEDILNDPAIPLSTDTRILVEREGYRSVLSVPIFIKGEPYGGLTVYWWQPHPVSAAEIEVMTALGGQAAVAIENARLFSDERSGRASHSALLEVNKKIGQLVPTDTLLTSVAEEAMRLLDVDNAGFRLLDGDDLVVAGLAGTAPATMLRPRIKVGESLAGRVVATGAALTGEIGVLPGLLPEHLEADRRLGYTHYMGLPLRVGDHIIGVLTFRARHVFSRRDQEVGEAFAGQAAVAIEHARLYQDRTRAYEDLALAQDQLVRSEKLRALGEMASGVAHDFNNLLAAILGRAQLLLHRVADPTARQWLQIIERSAADGAKTVRRLQEFTRIRRDQPAVAVDLNQVVREALELTESSWRLKPPRRGIVIHAVTELAADLPTTLSDPAELREVMTNLILNAVDAMPRGGTLTLSTAPRGESIELRVVDTGVGIPEAVRSKIFDPFFTTKGPKGTGLGLSMTYGILSRHGATITVDSQEGQGTAFTLLFPVGAAPRTPRPDTGAAVPAVTLRCLVVDDEESVGDMLADVLRSAGHTVGVARSASEGLSRVRSEPLDLLFSDLSMPGMTGWELARAVRDAAPGLPVILVSGFAVEVSQDELQASGVHSVLAKPVNIGEVLDAAAAIRPRRERGGERP